MKPAFNEDEFFGFAKSYLSEAFPNRHRIDCPPDLALQQMAEHPVAERDNEISKHLTCCSPCFSRYMEILAHFPVGHPAKNGWATRLPQPALNPIEVYLFLHIWSQGRKCLKEELGRSIEDCEVLVETGWSKAKDIRRTGWTKRKIENITIAEYLLQQESHAIREQVWPKSRSEKLFSNYIAPGWPSAPNTNIWK